MKTSSAGITLIKEFEDVRLQSYRCAAGIWTIGAGHTGPDVTAGQTITEARADELLAADLAKFEKAVTEAVAVELSQHQFDACVSLCFNIGAGAFRTSTLLKKLNAGDYAGAAMQFARWNRAGGKVRTGLVRRRAAEALLFTK